jgi:hypothetical protein
MSGLTNSILKVIWFVSVFNLLFLGSLPFYEENIKGEHILSDYVDVSKDLNGNINSKDISADVPLYENKTLTIVFQAEEPYTDSELLKVNIVDPQNREYSLKKTLNVSSVRGRASSGTIQEYVSFTPVASGMHHIKISNAKFQTNVELVSGMVNPFGQPFFLVTLFISLVIALTGLLSLRKKTIMDLVYSGKIANELIYFCLTVPISWIIVNSVIRW